MKKITLLLALMLFVVTGSFAQASLYTFSQSSGTYVPITGGTVVTSATSIAGTLNPLDSYVSGSLTLPTPFKFAGTTYTTFFVTSNGQITLGGSAPSAYSTKTLSSSFGSNAVIAPFSADLSVANLAAGSIRFEQVGNELVIQWSNFRRYNKAESFNFQARLNTINGEIKYIYDGIPPYAVSTDYYPQVGIKNATGTGGYIALTVPAAGSWNTPSAITTGVADSSVATFNGAVGFTSGLTYTFTPPAGCGPEALAGGTSAPANSLLCTGIAPGPITVTGATNPTNWGVAYQWEESTNGTTWSSVTGGTGANSSVYTPPVYAGTPIQYRLKVSCGGSDAYSSIAAVNSQTVPLTQASALVAHATANAIVANWTNGSGTRRLVIVSTTPITDPASGPGTAAYTATAAFANTGQQIVYDGTGSSVTVTGLTCNTSYYVKVFEYSRCGSGPYDVYLNTTSGTNAVTVSATPAVAGALPITNNFTDFTGTNLATVAPGWYEASKATVSGSTPSSSDPVGASSVWTSSAVLGQTTAKVNLYTDDTNAWIISPKIAITANTRLKFKAAITNYNNGNVDSEKMTGTDDKVYVLVSTDGCGSTWTPIYTFDASTTTTLTNVLTDYTLALNAYIGQTIQIAFQGTDGPLADDPDYDFHIGSILVEPIPTCDVPALQAATNITKNSATIAWNEPLVGIPTGYQYVVSTTGTAPTGAGTATTALTASVTGLLPDTDYYVFVRTVCGADFSDWSIAGTFTTMCDYPDITLTTPGARCGFGTVELAATAATGTLKWYTTATGGTALGAGAMFTTPSILETTTFYVSGETVGTPVSGGARPSTTITGGTTPSEYGLVFNAISTFTLNSVDVYLNTTTAGSVVIELQDNNGGVLQTATIAVPAGNTTTPVQHTLPLGWTILPGNGYRLMAISGPGMVRESALGGFPYALGASGSVINGYAFGGTSSSYYFFYNWNFTEVCSSPRMAVTATVNASPALTLSGNPAIVCTGQTTGPVTITAGATDYDTYTWTPSTGVSGNATTGWTFNPAATTVYTLNASQSSGAMCTANPIAVTVSISNLPQAIVLADATVCEAGAAVALTPTGGITANLLLNENFNAPTNNWLTVNNSIGGNVAEAAWTLQPDGYELDGDEVHTNDDSQFYVTNSDAQGSSSDITETILRSPAFSTFGYTNVTLNFYHYFYEPSEGSSTGEVQASIDGVAWTTLTAYEESAGEYDDFAAANIALPTAFVNKPTVYIRFKYEGEWRYYWSIDNVSVTGYLAPGFTFTPVTGLYTDAAATTAYTGTPAATVYAKPLATTTYTVTATNTVGCSTSDTVDVTFSSIDAPAVAAPTQQFCNAGTVADLVATGTGIKWYAAATGGTALTPNTVLVNNTPYYASQTVGGCESALRTERTAIINVVTVPTVPAPTQEICNAGTVADLVATGTGIKWYADATGGTALTDGVELVDGVVYHASQTIDGCESVARTPLTINVNVIDAPGVPALTQDICNAGTVADLVATGTGIKWYADATGGTALTDGVELVDGMVYHASQTIDGCESVARTPLTVNINIIDAPGVPAPTQEFCNAGTVADLVATGTDIKWYAAASGGTALDMDTPLANTEYFASQTIDGCESIARISRIAVINITPAPTATDDDVTQEFCDAGTVGDLDVTGESIVWYDAATGGNVVANDAPLVDGTVYYASQSIEGCEGLTRLGVTAVITTVTVETLPDVNECHEYTLPVLANGNYYTEAGGEGTLMVSGEVIAETTTLFIYAEAGTDVMCTAESSFVITIADIDAPDGAATQSFEVTNPADATIEDIVVDIEDDGTITWYNTEAHALAGENALPAGTQLVSGEDYFATQTIGTCTSEDVFEVVVDVVLGRDGFSRESFTAYPNPVKDVLNLSYTSDIISVTVFNLLGQQVISKQPNAAEVKLDMSSLADGAYVVNITAGNTVKTIKVIKKQ